ncbi:ubiquitin-conjugating enzyme/RWD-like protein, partial [Lipomyces mesembrius]
CSEPLGGTRAKAVVGVERSPVNHVYFVVAHQGITTKTLLALIIANGSLVQGSDQEDCQIAYRFISLRISKMLKIWSMKQQQQQQQKEAEASGDGSVKKKVTAAQIRVQKDLTELSLPSTMKTHFPNPDDLLHFNVAIEPDEGMYQGGKFNFSFTINNSFPHEPPKVKCTQKIYHPNIDLEGNVCLNILREDWKPVLNLYVIYDAMCMNAVLVGLQYLFLEPNAADPLNKEAASDLQHNRENFRRNVRNSMNGGYVGHEKFERVVNA